MNVKLQKKLEASNWATEGRTKGNKIDESKIKEYLDKECPKCGLKLRIVEGKHGNFIACSGFSVNNCRYTMNIEDYEKECLQIIDNMEKPKML